MRHLLELIAVVARCVEGKVRLSSQLHAHHKRLNRASNPPRKQRRITLPRILRSTIGQRTWLGVLRARNNATTRGQHRQQGKRMSTGRGTGKGVIGCLRCLGGKKSVVQPIAQTALRVGCTITHDNTQGHEQTWKSARASKSSRSRTSSRDQPAYRGCQRQRSRRTHSRHSTCRAPANER